MTRIREFVTRGVAEASMQMFATTSKSVKVLGFFMAISSIVLMSLTPSQKALTILMS
jgi:hypothetical protein